MGPGTDAAVFRLSHRADARRARHSRLLRQRRRIHRPLRLRREDRQVDRRAGRMGAFIRCVRRRKSVWNSGGRDASHPLPL